MIDGALLLFDAHEALYRMFAPGTWFDVFAASLLDCTEMHELRDVNDATGEDLREGMRINPDDDEDEEIDGEAN